MSFRYFNTAEQMDQFIDSLHSLKLSTPDKLQSLKTSLYQNFKTPVLDEQLLKNTHAQLSNLSAHAHNSKRNYHEFQNKYTDLNAAKLKIIAVEELVKECSLEAKLLAKSQIAALFTALVLIVSAFAVFIGLTVGLGSIIPTLPMIALLVFIPLLLTIILGTHFCLKKINQRFDDCFAQAVSLDNQINQEIKPLRQLVYNIEQNPQIIADYDNAINHMDRQIATIITQLDEFIEDDTENQLIEIPYSQSELLVKHGIFENIPSCSTSYPNDNSSKLTAL